MGIFSLLGGKKAGTNGTNPDRGADQATRKARHHLAKKGALLHVSTNRQVNNWVVVFKNPKGTTKYTVTISGRTGRVIAVNEHLEALTLEQAEQIALEVIKETHHNERPYVVRTVRAGENFSVQIRVYDPGIDDFLVTVYKNGSHNPKINRCKKPRVKLD